jgi:hypothetical protein
MPCGECTPQALCADATLGAELPLEFLPVGVGRDSYCVGVQHMLRSFSYSLIGVMTLAGLAAADPLPPEDGPMTAPTAHEEGPQPAAKPAAQPPVVKSDAKPDAKPEADKASTHKAAKSSKKPKKKAARHKKTSAHHDKASHKKASAPKSEAAKPAAPADPAH